jgi:hypothetical protein
MLIKTRLKPVTRELEVIGTQLATFLNEEPNSEVSKWALEIVRLLMKGSSRPKRAANSDLISVGEQDLAALERLLTPHQFRIYPRGVVRGGDWLMSMIPVDPGPCGGLALFLRDLASAGAIVRFRRCRNCNSWFFSMRGGQLYCPGGKCREEFRRSQPEYMEKQRERVLTHYYRVRGRLPPKAPKRRRKHGKR